MQQLATSLGSYGRNRLKHPFSLNETTARGPGAASMQQGREIMLIRFTCGLLLAVLPKVSVAEWAALPFGTPANAHFSGTYYFDSKLVSRKGNISKGSWMLTLSEPRLLNAYKRDRRLYASQIAEGEFDCSTREYKLTSNRFYSGPNATGELLQSTKGDTWRALKNGWQIWAFVWERACS
jgi:hypothetical protein